MLKLISAIIVLSGAICVPASLLTISGETRELRSLAAQSQNRIGGSEYEEGDPSTTIPFSSRLTPTKAAGSLAVAEVAKLGPASADDGGLSGPGGRSEHHKYAGEMPQPSRPKFESSAQDAGTRQQMDETAGGVEVGPQPADEPRQPCGNQDAGVQMPDRALVEHAEGCPRCESMFEKLGRTEHGTNVQDISMQVPPTASEGWGFTPRSSIRMCHDFDCLWTVRSRARGGQPS